MSDSRRFAVYRFAHFVFAWSCYLILLITLGYFVLFLSSQNDVRQSHRRPSWLPGLYLDIQVSGVLSILCRLIFDGLLLAIFIAQHSIMSSEAFKNFLNFPKIERSIYVAATSLSLQLLVNFWFGIPEIIIWRIDTENSTLWWWTFFLVHFVSWVTMYGVAIMMDYSEMVGLKQANYANLDLADPLQYKSVQLRRLFAHMRHPSFTCLCILLYFRNVMSVDRLLLAFSFTVYMMVRFRVDEHDYEYLKCQSALKMNKLRW